MSEKILLLMNGSSGFGRGKSYLYDIVHALSMRGCVVTVLPIDPSSGLLPEKDVKEIGGFYDKIVCYGGDGTLNHLVNTLYRNNIRKPIGYIPGGSTNDFAKNFNESREIEKLCDHIVNGKEFTYDIGSLNDMYFNYIAAFGAFTEVSYSTDQNMKNVLGNSAYMVNVLGTLGEQLSFRKHVIFEHDGEVEEGDYVYVGISNSPSVGGIKVPYIEDTKLNDGLFEVLLVSAPNNPMDLAILGSDMASGYMDSKYIRTFKTSCLKFTAEKDIHWTLDGEDAGMHKSGTIQVIPNGMTIMIGK